MINKLFYIFHSGKNPKFIYYSVNEFRRIMPKWLFGFRLKKRLRTLEKREDKEYILSRVNYYNQLEDNTKLPKDAPILAHHKLQDCKKVYFYDSYEFTRWFPQNLHWGYFPGDVTTVPDYPSIVKSRPLHVDNRNSVIMKLEKVRHFTFIHDKKSFHEKENKVIFRGKIHGKPIRYKLLEMYFKHPMCDLGDVGKQTDMPSEWKKPKLTIYQHLKYKFILSMEGNDVASNLKWVMSSNSIAVMPRPTCETWFMEGTLIPNYHYIEIKQDLSDLEERLNYYILHEDEAQQIIEHAHAYVKPFKDKKRERLISLWVLQKFFEKTGQLSPI